LEVCLDVAASSLSMRYRNFAMSPYLSVRCVDPRERIMTDLHSLKPLSAYS
jgi:hypothetical protein